MRDFSSCSETTPSLSWTTTSLWERLDAKVYDERCAGVCYTSAQYHNLPRDDRQNTKVHSDAWLLSCMTHGWNHGIYSEFQSSLVSQCTIHLIFFFQTSSLFRPYNMKDIESGLSNVEENSSFNHTPWSKFYKNEKSSCLGLPCRELLLGDVCIPLSSSEKTTQNENASTTTPELKPWVFLSISFVAFRLPSIAECREEIEIVFL